MSVQDDKGTTGTGTLVTDLAATPPAGTPPAATEPAGTPPVTPVPPATPDPAKPTDKTPAADLPSWSTSTTKNVRADPRFATWASKFKTLDEAVMSSIETDEKVGKLVAIPDDKATDEQRNEFYSKLGVPVKPQDYKIDIDPAFNVEAKAVEEFKALAHAHHMTNETANSFFKMAAERTQNEIAAYRARTEQVKQDTTAALKKEWGPQYDSQVAILARGIRAIGDESLIADAEATGMGNKLSFIKLLHKFGTMSKEDGAVHKGAGGAGGDKSAADVLYPKTK